MRRGTRQRRIWAGLVSLALAWPGVAQAAPEDSSPPVAAEPESVPADKARAKELYDKGRASFDTTDYEAAISAWTEAYSTLSDNPANAPIKAALIYNLATAQERAFGIDKDVTHLRRAEDLMEAYQRSIPALYADAQEAAAEQTKIEQRLAQVRQQIEDAEAAEADAAPPAQESIFDSGEAPPPTDDAAPDPNARIYIISGAALLGAGAAGLGLMAAGLALGSQADSDVPADLDDRRTQFDRGRAGNTMAYVGAGLGGALIVTGAVLLGLGLKRRRSTSVSASMFPGQAGLVLRGRF